MGQIEAERAMREKLLVGTGNVPAKGGNCLYTTGYLLKMVKVRGKKEKEFFFRDRWGEVGAIRPASAFTFVA
ncbi:MAG: hypothetical protein CO031_00780 [Candidatus Nealsonbacteria bacterium CG_4_9_14_0_2_um_filter_37_38]|uniref:Uncharacterized protein n=1 Tax=Candidatus Nealsonbacteria bacterium CG_4_10_14_0_8_um_filter_37_14 TaxID=1974684 RepID=A0A2M7R6G4_9BACT|nr:MAG: hypothetical protein COV63_01440 [Candidatus Nealsonbacteria bacterium CG11_big_fil_rev_8_21_14_0_20_37_68]PIW92248.1 MAG: hypothetical protein COZ89_00865 [Candidatus Nealsonbacteria bacterium CG_4_8_14_3_um_filter_37_23]PIY88681.1 MAG: hypothetical protein COY73_03105 [Candidatus Nealsonbacteria bacterium CG_4_10_14_0_8_um_filter_37_14]PJC51811.1 MAG: hypothetical protein CO031_00780 [Candidatus Nealsonbacteria bacterium CG_4_9_14_0_2_um_filter_37_38]